MLVLSLAAAAGADSAVAQEVIDVPYEKVVIPGTGDSQSLLRALARRFERIQPEAGIEIPDSIGSTGGIKAVVSGKAKLARVARPLKGKESNLGLTYQCFASSAVVFVVHPSVSGIDNLTTEEIIAIYSGKIRNWKQLGDPEAGKIYAIIREPGDSSLTVLNNNIAGFKDIPQPQAKTIYSTPETVEALVKHRGTIGFLPIAMTADTNLRIIKVDGIYPSPENIASGRYKLTVPFAIVYKEELSGAAKAFVDFLYSEEAKKIITGYKTIPME